MPKSKKIRKWIDNEMESVGLKFNRKGASVSFPETCKRLIEKVFGNASLGPGKPTRHIQIMADGVTVYRQTVFTSVACRVLDTNPDYNSMTSMSLL